MEQEIEKDLKQVKRVTKHTWRIVVLMAIGLIAGSLLSSLLIQKLFILAPIDDFFYELISQRLKNPLLDLLVIPIDRNFLPFGWATLPSFIYVLIVIPTIYVALRKRKELPWLLITILIGTLFVGVLYSVNAKYAFRQRPFISLPNTLDDKYKSSLVKWTSFPSGHARETAMYSTIIAAYIPEVGVLLAIFSIFVGISRVYVGAHYPTDVLAGLIIGYLAGRISILATKEVQKIVEDLWGKHFHRERLPK